MYNLLKNKIMNKKSFLALSFAAIAIVSGYAGVKAFRSQACRENDLLAQNIEALSEDEGQEKLYERIDEDCVYEFTGKAGAKLNISVFGGEITTLTFDATGHASYTYHSGKTRCIDGGKEQCTARYCPQLSQL